MVDLWKTYTFDTTNFDRYFIGADAVAKKLMEAGEQLANTAISNYPPYNLKKTEENKYVLEMAIAGFGKQDIEITLEENKLVIKGNTKAIDTKEADKLSFLHKGIADRGFTRAFTLADNVEIHDAKLINGMLRVWLEHVIPEANKPKKIHIKDEATDTVDSKNNADPKFLVE
jgi:molecular chaperone IbpA